MSFDEQLQALKLQSKPRFAIPEEMIQEAQDWKVGDEQEIKIKVTLKAIREVAPGKNEVMFEIDEVEASEGKNKGLERRVARLEMEADSFDTA
jgi:hypothetical protein